MATEKRLIDANALLLEYCQANGCNEVNDEVCPNCFTAGLIAEPPTVDAVEVVHGEWEIIEDDYLDLVELKCSACGESYGFEDYEDCIPKNYHYCPHCGAKMDLEVPHG